MLEKEYEFYKSNQTTFVGKYLKKYIVIKEQAVIGVYETQEAALTETIKDHKIGTFLIQYVAPVGDDTILRFYSRAYV